MELGWIRAGMFLAIAGAIVSGSVQALLIFGNYYASAPGPQAELAAALRIALLGVGVMGALARRPWIVIIVFLVHTWPTGLYMMLLPGIGAYAGLATLAMPIGAGLMFVGRRKHRPGGAGRLKIEAGPGV
jgi:hypothetical protein